MEFYPYYLGWRQATQWRGKHRPDLGYWCGKNIIFSMFENEVIKVPTSNFLSEFVRSLVTNTKIWIKSQLMSAEQVNFLVSYKKCVKSDQFQKYWMKIQTRHDFKSNQSSNFKDRIVFNIICKISFKNLQSKWYRSRMFLKHIM